MEQVLSFPFGGDSKQTTKWRQIGFRSQKDLIRITYSSTPYASAEDTIHQAVMRGGLAYRQNGELKDFPPGVMIDLKDLLIQFHRWFLMFGMVAMFTAPDRPPFFCVVPDPRTGYFVARHTPTKTIEVGWRFTEQDELMMQDEKFPDPRVHVFVWPGHQPDMLSGQPFRSRLSVLLRPHAMIEEFRENTLDGEYLGTHPPLITTMRLDGHSGSGGGDLDQQRRPDVSRTATEAARAGRTQNAHREITLADTQLEAEGHYERRAAVVYDTRVRRSGYRADGKRRVIMRGDLWGNRLPLRAGTVVERGPVPVAMPTWVDRERFFIETIYRALGVPMRGGTSPQHRRSQGGSAETTMTGDDMLQLRQTVMNTRQGLIDAFTFMYQHFMSESSVSAAREHHRNVLVEMDTNINSLKKYLDYLGRTDQLDTEPMIAQKKRLKEYNEQVERRRIIAERTQKIVSQAHKHGKFVDQEVVFKHLSDIYDLQQQREEARSHMEKDIEGMRNVTLEFRHPPNVDSNHLLQLARDGMFNPREALRLYAVSAGMSEEEATTALEGVDFIPLQRKAELEQQKESEKQKFQLEKQRLEFEKTKEENKVRLENKKIAAAEKAAEQKPAAGGSAGSSGSSGSSGSGEKRKSSEETKSPAKKKK